MSLAKLRQSNPALPQLLATPAQTSATGAEDREIQQSRRYTAFCVDSWRQFWPPIVSARANALLAYISTLTSSVVNKCLIHNPVRHFSKNLSARCGGEGNKTNLIEKLRKKNFSTLLYSVGNCCPGAQPPASEQGVFFADKSPFARAAASQAIFLASSATAVPTSNNNWESHKLYFGRP